MKRLIIILTALLMLTACGTPILYKPELQNGSPVPASLSVRTASVPTDGKYRACNYETVKAVWISYLELAPIVSDGEEHFREAFAEMCINCRSVGVNTLITHVRTFGDAFYPSKLFPQTKAFCGKSFDALAVMTEEAHKQGLSIHAWINPLRCEVSDILDKTSDKFKIGQWYHDPSRFDSYIMNVEDTGHWWLNPGIDEVRRLIAAGAAEIVRNYEVDGIHIDDYFYPTTEGWFDAGIYVEQGSDLPLNEWRLENCNKMVKGIYDAVKQENPTVEFGIAPQGNIENNYNYMFADVRKWCAENGFCDYICPQIYFGYNNPYKPFAPTLAVWQELCGNSGRKLLIGIAAYKINTEDEFVDDIGIISRQAELALSRTDGAVLFSYNSLFTGERGSLEADCLRNSGFNSANN